MNRIKVKPDFFPNFEGKLTYTNGSDAKTTSFEEKEDGISNELIMIFKDENDTQKVLKLNGFDYKNSKFISSIPNPFFLLLNIAIDSCNDANGLINNFKKSSNLIGEKTYFFELDENYTSEIYNSFLSKKITSINSIINSLEIFINQKIPKDFIFVKKLNEKEIRLNKTKIEATLSFKEKILKLLPEIFPEIDFNTISNEINLIFEVYNLRKEIIHMKTGSNSLFDQYYEVMGKILNAKIEPYILSSIKFINLINTDLVEFVNTK